MLTDRLQPTRRPSRPESQELLQWVRLAVIRALAEGVPWSEIDSVIEGCRHSHEHRMTMLADR